jgi:hypothetical protein
MAPKVTKRSASPKPPLRSGTSRSSSRLKALQGAATSDTQTSSFVTRTNQSKKRSKASTGDSDFEVTQLIPRGIEIQKGRSPRAGYLAGAYAYFHSKAPPDPAESREFYRSIFQDTLAERVVRDINDSIFLSVADAFAHSVHTAYRILGEARLPPLLSPDNPPSIPFEFDIRPDFQFWLCDRILNTDYRDALSQLVHCKAFGTFCPYFSIEFKAHDTHKRVVVNQVATASSISLFNRYQLKRRAYPDYDPEHFKLVRHFGLTMEKEDWVVWYFEPKIADGAWTTCKAMFLDSGTCRSEQGVRWLLPWINEVHRWGLCEYALECEDDIKHILREDAPDMDMSDIAPE